MFVPRESGIKFLFVTNLFHFLFSFVKFMCRDLSTQGAPTSTLSNNTPSSIFVSVMSGKQNTA